MKKIVSVYLLIFCFIGAGSAFAVEKEKEDETELQEIVVEAPKAELKVTPVTDSVPHITTRAKITAKQIENFNAINIEDTVKYLPNLFVRKRYIGDPNGVVAFRGNSVFQTGRSMVFMDGFPLHNLLETRWNGSPRWSIMAPEEVISSEVIYGPFSPAYSGNAMGGLVNVKTKFPQEREFLIKQSYFIQDYELYGTRDGFEGNKTHVSFGDRVGDFSFFTFYDHLQNDGHPQSMRSDLGSFSAATRETTVTGAFRTEDSRNRDIIIYGDTGTAETDIDVFKFKGRYEFNSNFAARTTFAYQMRDSKNTPNNYLKDASGNPIWGDGSNRTDDAQYGGVAFNVANSNFSVTEGNRDDVLIGAGIDGKLGGGWEFDTTGTYFHVINDVSRTSDEHPNDPRYDRSGLITEYDNTGWETFDHKFGNKAFLDNPDLDFYVGYHYAHYTLETRQYNANNYKAGKDSFRSSSGGDTDIHGLFGVVSWEFLPEWEATVGGRQEWWRSYNGFINSGSGVSEHPDRSESEISPKFSLAHKPAPPWELRFSLAKAYRFPIVEELYSNVSTQNSTSLADATLKPEDGFHKTFIIKRTDDNGEVSLTFFEDDVDDVIYSQQDISTNVSTFLGIDRVRTRGTEFAVSHNNVLNSGLDVVFNAGYLHSKILENSRNPSTEGNRFPRVPKWRVSFFPTYHITKAWDASMGVRYASYQYDRLENDDTNPVFGSVSNFLVTDFKTSYHWKNGIKASFGIDNINNDKYYVAHPMPQRTFYMNAEWKF